MTQNIVIGVMILVMVSLVVRIIPAFVRFPFSKNTQENIKLILPTAVFINLFAYCIVSEINANHLVASLSFILLFGLLTAVNRIGLLATVCIVSVAFILLKQYPIIY